MTDRDDMKARSEEVAKHLLAALDEDADPALAEASARKEREDAEILEAFYVQTGQKPKRARNAVEMHFAARLQPCPNCGTRELGELDPFTDDSKLWTYVAKCPKCKKPRSFDFVVEERPGDEGPYELGAGPSHQIMPAEFAAELARVTPLVNPRPTELVPPAWRQSFEALRQALFCVFELIKLTDAGPERDRLAVERDRLLAIGPLYKADAERNWKLEHPHEPKGELSSATVRAHQRWVEAGRRGEGRLELDHVEARNARVGAANLTSVRMHDVDLSGAKLEAAKFDDADLHDVKFDGAGLDSASFRGARITGGSFRRARMSIAKFYGAVVAGSDFSGADLERSPWERARVEGATFERVRFGDASFDHTELARCNLRGASFASIIGGTPPITRGTRFVDCDLRDTDWARRDLTDVTFVRCKLAGAHGKAAKLDVLGVIDCDLSRDELVRLLTA